MSKLLFTEGTAPATPETDEVALYAKTDKKLYFKDDDGTETEVGGGGGGAPDDAEYIIRVADAGLANAQVLGSLATGLMMSTTTTGVVSTIKHNSGQYAPTGRLSLSSTLAVPVASLTAQTTLYYHPFNGDTIWLYNGTTWLPHTFASAISIAIPATTDTNYDVFVYDNVGTLTLELLVWTGATTRTALGTQNGWAVRGSDATRLYVGTIRTDSVSGQCSIDFGDTTPRMNIWNRFHQVQYTFRRIDNTNSWTYAVATTARSANADNANRFSFVVGLDESPITATVAQYISGTVGQYVANGVALDATNAIHSQIRGSFYDSTGGQLASWWSGYSGIGSHFLQWVEFQSAASTCTYYGDNGATVMTSGLTVNIRG